MAPNRHPRRFRQGGCWPGGLPSQIVSNEEFVPPAQTAAQSHCEHLAAELIDATRRQLGMGRREFLRTTGAVAASLLAMNTVFGRFFDVLPIELAEAAAFRERQGDPFFIFDVQTHYVGAGYDPGREEATRKGAVTADAL